MTAPHHPYEVSELNWRMALEHFEESSASTPAAVAGMDPRFLDEILERSRRTGLPFVATAEICVSAVEAGLCHWCGTMLSHCVHEVSEESGGASWDPEPTEFYQCRWCNTNDPASMNMHLRLIPVPPKFTRVDPDLGGDAMLVQYPGRWLLGECADDRAMVARPALRAGPFDPWADGVSQID